MSREMKNSGIEWIGEIPVSWEVLRNKYNFVLDKRIIGNKCEAAQLLSLTKNGIKAITEEEQSGKVPTSFTTYQVVDTDDLVMCLFDLDVSAVFSGISPYSGMISPAYKCLKCKDHLYPQYVDYYFRTVFVDRKYLRYSKNVRYSLSSDEFMALPIIVPPLPEQHRIADFLDSKCSQIDEISKKIQEEIDTLEEYKKSVITEAVTKGLDPNVEMKDSGINWIGDIPKDWRTGRVKDIAEMVTVGVVVKPADYFDENGTVPFIRGINIKENCINDDPMVYISEKANSVLKKTIVFTGDLLIVRDGNIGVTASVTEKFNGANVVSLVIVRPKKEVNGQYFCYLLNSLIGINQFQITKIGSALTHTSVESVSNITITIPPKQMQDRISDYLDNKWNTANAAIMVKQQQLSTLDEYKKSLIYEYVTGKKEVSDADA